MSLAVVVPHLGRYGDRFARTMPTFLDESGDTGHEPDSASTFRLAAVSVPTQAEAEKVRTAIQQLRQVLGLPAGYEFKFAKTGAHPERRKAFFREAMGCDFSFAAVSLNKQTPEWRTAHRGAIHWACAVSLAVTLRETYCSQEEARALGGNDRPLNELVVVDDNEDREFLKVISKKFGELRSRRHPKRSLVGKVKFRGSGPDELVQLADLVCGAVGAHLDGDSTWYNMIAARDLGITRIP